MFEYFSEKAIKVIMLAQEEARRLGHNFVGTEQILVGLVTEGVDIEKDINEVKSAVEKIIGRGSGRIAVELPFTPRAKRALELASKKHKEMNHSCISIVHLFYGIINIEESTSVKVLETLNCDISKLKEKTNSYLELFKTNKTNETVASKKLNIEIEIKNINAKLDKILEYIEKTAGGEEERSLLINEDFSCL